jgi:uncharacterized protein (TIGR02284 family)
MGTMVGTDRVVVELLNHLISLDYDAIEAYRAAVLRIKDSADRAQLGQFMADHERHVTELSALVQGLGGRPSNGPDLKQILTKGKVLVSAVMGDRAILRAMKMNEDDTTRVYERASSHAGLPQAVLEVIRKNLEDERRHRAYSVSRLEARPIHAH